MTTAPSETEIKVQIILGSSRPNRAGQAVAEWVYETAKGRTDAEVELVDVAAFALPLLDEPLPPSLGRYAKDHTKRWAAKIVQADGYVFVTGEYNRSIPGALKNAIDYLYAEWNDKAAGFVGYGAAGGSRAIEHLRGVMAEVQIADVRAQLLLSLATDFENRRLFRPTERHAQQLQAVLDQVVRWSRATRERRTWSVCARVGASTPTRTPPPGPSRPPSTGARTGSMAQFACGPGPASTPRRRSIRAAAAESRDRSSKARSCWSR